MSRIIRYAEPIYKDKMSDYVNTGMQLVEQQISNQGVIDILQWNNENMAYSNIFCGQSNICVETARILSSDNFTILPELNNIKHDFNSFNTNNNCLREIRKNSILSFFDDKNIESKSSVLERIDRLLKINQKYPNSLYISHGYFMKIMEIQLHYNRKQSQLSPKQIALRESKSAFFGSLLGFDF